MYSGLLAPKGVSNQERRIARGDKQFNDRVRDSLIIGCDAKREPEETSTTIVFNIGSTDCHLQSQYCRRLCLQQTMILSW